MGGDGKIVLVMSVVIVMSVLSWARTGSDRICTERPAEVKLNGNKWKPAHCIGPARHGPLRQASEQLRNTGQRETFRRSEAGGRPITASKRRVLCVLCSNFIFVIASWKHTSLE
jgi:hypothetical protein